MRLKSHWLKAGRVGRWKKPGSLMMLRVAKPAPANAYLQSSLNMRYNQLSILFKPRETAFSYLK